jgi:5-formyltetrahydrofolate cyclo-ligase
VTCEAKAALRRAVLRRRAALPEGERALLSGRIVATILDLPTYKNADVVLAYASFGAELQTDELLRRVLNDGKVLVLPRVEGGGLGLYEVRDLTSDLAPGTWGIREPGPDQCPAVDRGGVGFALIPGVAFDRGGGVSGTAAASTIACWRAACRTGPLSSPGRSRSRSWTRSLRTRTTRRWTSW